ncbi:hypothetical protein R3P38DRAFT_2987066 [Favolaschia claudopus]|uniref:F-box domain-containing protein n=1 Tax=Favolaschia claudopus TaxID=2862362 RepID=A0AAW0AV67_9AGAR
MLSSLAADRKRLAEIDSKILEIGDDGPDSELRLERELTQKRLDDYKYPVLTLPDETILEIFLQLLPVYPVCPPRTGLGSPTLLSHICSQWRKIALASPGLWRGMAVLLCRHPKFAERRRRQMDLTDTWLVRSRSLPLSLDIISKDLYGEIDGPGLYEGVVAQIHRWEHVRMSSDIIGMGVFNDLLPSLRSVRLLDGDAEEYPRNTAFKQAPLLRALSGSSSLLLYATLPWSQLTSLALEGFYPHFVPILRKTPNLLHCELQINDTWDLPCEPFRIQLLRLTSLVLKGPWCFPMSRQSTHELMRSISTPALRRLTVAASILGAYPRSSTPALATFISNSEDCELEELNVVYEGCGADRDCDCESEYRHKFPAISNIFVGGFR